MKSCKPHLIHLIVMIEVAWEMHQLSLCLGLWSTPIIDVHNIFTTFDYRSLDDENMEYAFIKFAWFTCPVIPVINATFLVFELSVVSPCAPFVAMFTKKMCTWCLEMVKYISYNAAETTFIGEQLFSVLFLLYLYDIHSVTFDFVTLIPIFILSNLFRTPDKWGDLIQRKHGNIIWLVSSCFNN